MPSKVFAFGQPQIQKNRSLERFVFSETRTYSAELTKQYPQDVSALVLPEHPAGATEPHRLPVL